MRKFVLLVSVVLVFFGWSSGAWATTLTFDSLPTGIITPFTENGYSITWVNYPNNTYAQAIQNVGGANQNVVVDGAPSNVYGTALRITRADAAPFSLISLDIANLGGTSRAMVVSGSTGGAVNYYPSSATFTTVSPGGMTDISWLEVGMITYGGTIHAIDNVSLSAVPEPNTMTKTIDFEELPVGLIPTSDTPIDVGDGFYTHSGGFAGDTRYNMEIFETSTPNGKAVRDGRDNAYGAGLYICRYDGDDFTLVSFDGADFDVASDSRPVYLNTFDEVWSNGSSRTAQYSYTVPQGSFANFAAGYTATCFEIAVMDYGNYDQAVDNIVVEWEAATCTAPGDFAPSTSSLAPFQSNHCEDWFGVSQPGENLQDAILTMTDLGSANLFGALLFNVDFTNALLTNANLVNARLEGATLNSADLTGADLSFANLTGATYDENTVFPSGNPYDTPPWDLHGGISPWNAGMVPVPEPALGWLVTAGVMGLAGLARSRRH